jgi:hypothetical protein
MVTERGMGGGLDVGDGWRVVFRCKENAPSRLHFFLEGTGEMIMSVIVSSTFDGRYPGLIAYIVSQQVKWRLSKAQWPSQTV